MPERLPDFLIIGAMKAGTTSLHAALDAHPDIAMSNPKEVDYFIEEKNFGRGESWYCQHFQTEAQVCGEASVNYTKRHAFSGVAERIAMTLPKAKLIYVLRDPIDRMVSHHHHSFCEGDESNEVNEALLEPVELNHYYQTSRYHFQAEPFLEKFPQDEIHFLTAESLRQDGPENLDRLADFLGVATFPDATSDRNLHRSSEKRMRPDFAKRLAESPLKKILRPLIPEALMGRYRAATEFVPEPGTLNEAVGAHLEDLLIPEVEALRKATGLGFEEWPRSY